MMKLNLTRLLISLFIISITPACSYIADYFPDKEKDYQLTKEIPELTVPSDLSGNHSQTVQESFSINSEENISEKDGGFAYKDNQGSVPVDLIEYSDDASTRIRISDSFIRSWRIVGKALSRHSIEITNRDVLNGLYHIQYDPEFEKVEDGSLWDEFLFIFGSDPAKEKEYKVKLVDKKEATEVFVLDSDGKEVSDGTGLVLLKLLYGQIKEDPNPDPGEEKK
ncbi:MAG: outer membrane protein assembly factor BamC [Methylococcaceae bacterium]|nr:outer membrane protein assembly factor BamC [Methylococcaceae bacterium]